MPSERSKPSEMTGENAARSKVRSISLATCCRPFCTTTSVTGSIASILFIAFMGGGLARDAQLRAQVRQHAVAGAGLPAHALADRDVLDLRHHLERRERRARMSQDGRQARLEGLQLVEGEGAPIARAAGDHLVPHRLVIG